MWQKTLLGEFLEKGPKAKGTRGQLKGDIPAGTRIVGGNKQEPPTKDNPHNEERVNHD